MLEFLTLIKNINFIFDCDVILRFQRAFEVRHKGFSRLLRIAKTAHARKPGAVSKCAEASIFYTYTEDPKCLSASEKKLFEKIEFSAIFRRCAHFVNLTSCIMPNPFHI